jgi:translation initiation factor 5B
LEVNLNVPGLMIIDTPGHESFSNLRSRGSSLCDIAILVIDLMHGLENQTLESLELLRKGNTPFVVALNKIDRCYGWESINDSPSFTALQRQKSETKHDFDTKFQKVIAELNVKGYNADLYWKVEDPDDYIPLVPTSGVTGEGIPDILSLLVKYATTIPRTVKKIKVKKDKFNCTVM